MTQQRRFTKEFEEEAVRLARTSGEPSARSPVMRRGRANDFCDPDSIP